MLHKLKSSVIDTATYDPAKMLLVLHFKSGKAYSYDGVPQKVVDGLLSAESAGKYHHAHLKGKYQQPKALK
jgi:hypothetical protein